MEIVNQKSRRTLSKFATGKLFQFVQGQILKRKEMLEALEAVKKKEEEVGSFWPRLRFLSRRAGNLIWRKFEGDGHLSK